MGSTPYKVIYLDLYIVFHSLSTFTLFYRLNVFSYLLGVSRFDGCVFVVEIKVPCTLYLDFWLLLYPYRKTNHQNLNQNFVRIFWYPSRLLSVNLFTYLSTKTVTTVSFSYLVKDKNHYDNYLLYSATIWYRTGRTGTSTDLDVSDLVLLGDSSHF